MTTDKLENGAHCCLSKFVFQVIFILGFSVSILLVSFTPSHSNKSTRGVRTLIFWVRIQSCFANCESKSKPDPVPTRFKQSDSCLSPGKYNSSKQPVTFFQWKQNPNPTRIRLQERKPHSWSCWKQPESG